MGVQGMQADPDFIPITTFPIQFYSSDVLVKYTRSIRGPLSKSLVPQCMTYLNCRAITLVDLPGLMHASNLEQGDRDIETVRKVSGLL